MSMPIAQQPATAPHGTARIWTRPMVGLALMLTLLPPSTLQRCLRTLKGNARATTAPQAQRIRATTCSVSARCAGEGCLQRSIAVYLICRLEGHAPGWKTGYQLEPFAAHAWVEVDGNPIDEPAAIRSYTTVLAVDQPEKN